MAHDRLQHISIFRSGSGLVIAANDTLGHINQHTGWLVEHLEMALGAYTDTPETKFEILHPIPKLPWKNESGQRLDTLRIRIARIRDIASSLPVEWFADNPVTGNELFIVSATLLRI